VVSPKPSETGAAPAAFSPLEPLLTDENRERDIACRVLSGKCLSSAGKSGTAPHHSRTAWICPRFWSSPFLPVFAQLIRGPDDAKRRQGRWVKPVVGRHVAQWYEAVGRKALQTQAAKFQHTSYPEAKRPQML